MGTRSLTHVKETYLDQKTGKKKTDIILTMYRQYDGYPTGHGAELVDFLSDSKVVNGFGPEETGKRVFNGASCLAAQLVAHFKKGVGGFYIYKSGGSGCGEEYTYEIEVDFNTSEVIFRCFKVGFINKKDKYVNRKRLLFEGKSENFLESYNKIKEANKDLAF